VTVTAEVVLPATCLQQRQVLGSLGAASVANMHFAWRLRGPLDLTALGRALDLLVARHDALRTALRVRHDEVEQHISPRCVLRPDLVGASRLASRGRRAAERLFRSHCREPFDLAAAPLARVALARLGVADHLLAWTLHHAICDGWSLQLLRQDFRAAYDAAVTGREPTWRDVAIQLGDYAAWERDLVDEEAEAHWRARLRIRPAALLLLQRDAQATGAGHVQEQLPLRPVSPAVVRALGEVARAHRATLSVLLTAAFAALVAPYAGGPSVALGITDANRDRAELRHVVGCCLDLVPIDVVVSGEPSFASVLERTRNEVFSAYAHRLPVGRLGDADWPQAPAWFDVLVNFTPAHPTARATTPDLGDLTVQPAFGPSPRRHAARYNWSGWRALGPILSQDGRGGLTGWLLYNRRLVTAELAHRLVGRFDRILRAIAIRPDQPLRSLPG